MIHQLDSHRTLEPSYGTHLALYLFQPHSLYIYILIYYLYTYLYIYIYIDQPLLVFDFCLHFPSVSNLIQNRNNIDH